MSTLVFFSRPRSWRPVKIVLSVVCCIQVHLRYVLFSVEGKLLVYSTLENLIFFTALQSGINSRLRAVTLPCFLLLVESQTAMVASIFSHGEFATLMATLWTELDRSIQTSFGRPLTHSFMTDQCSASKFRRYDIAHNSKLSVQDLIPTNFDSEVYSI
jgi:hypothetical protein